jgi:hypothetical protein
VSANFSRPSSRRVGFAEVARPSAFEMRYGQGSRKRVRSHFASPSGLSPTAADHTHSRCDCAWSAAGVGSGRERQSGCGVSEGRVGASKDEMPGGKENGSISRRIRRSWSSWRGSGWCRGEVMAMWAGTRRAVTATRERRLREAGLVEVLAGVGDSWKLVLCTRAGLWAVSGPAYPCLAFRRARSNTRRSQLASHIWATRISRRR